ncbi:MAG: UDP-N-acetylglucosamine 1-carboxyvinyltransferase [Alphaproteobacteria bacterium]|nr:UDP-N-acetylglucosamine 1-carboxyvinyltransferase [Alphaproteobacteria bacterium]
MDQIRITGGQRLSGRIPISGSKNSGLALMAATLLTGEPVTLANLPALADIASMTALLRQHGVEIKARDGATSLNAEKIISTTAPYDIVRKMRASVLVLGPLLARFREATVSLPGGCAIGSRPVDLHIKGLQQLGAEIEVTGGYIRAKAPKGLKGANVVFPKVSVGATENLVMAATLAEGETVLDNVAREPEIADLVALLVALGARIKGAGTETLRIEGVPQLHGAKYSVMADRIETGTFAIAAAITGGSVSLDNTRLDLIDSLAERLVEAGAVVTKEENGFQVSAERSLVGIDVMTEPFPGFPTDLQAQFMALMTVARGASMLTETIFENRFMHVPELRRMGANINLHGSSAMVRGVKRLTGADVMASDLRASASLVLAGLVADGDTVVHRIYHLDRGYERLEEKLVGVGARIERSRD